MDSAKPLISVIIPTHNRADLLPRAIKSVLDQTFTDFEVIIVDDASIDDTEAVVKQMGDNRVRYIRHTHNLGGSAARNTGIREARGEYIAFLDDDDEYLPEKLKMMLQALSSSSNKVGLAYSKVKLIDYYDTVTFPDSGHNGNIFLTMLAAPQFHISSTLIKKNCIVFFDETLPRYQDVDFHLGILEKFEAVFVNSITSIWHWGENRERVTLKTQSLEAAIKIMEQKYFINKGYKNNASVYGRFLRTVGNIFVVDNKACDIGRRYLKRSLKVHAEMITFIDYIFSFAGHSLFRWMNTVKRKIYLLANRKHLINSGSSYSGGNDR